MVCAIFLLIGCSGSKTTQELKKLVTNMVEIKFLETEDILKVSCAKLLKVFKDDKEKAKMDYIRKKYMISGIVMGTYSIGGLSYIFLGDGSQPIENGIFCYFEDNFPFDIKSDDIKRLNKDDKVTVKGTIDIDENVIFVQNCKLLDKTSIKQELITP